MEVIPEQWTSSLTTISRKFRKVWDRTERSSQNQIYTCMVKMILKSWYIAWEGRQVKRIGKTLEKKTRVLVTEKRTLCYWLNYYNRVTQATPRTIFVSYILNNSSNHLWSLSFFYNQANSFSHVLQIYCLGLLGRNPILFRVQAKIGPYNIYI